MLTKTFEIDWDDYEQVSKLGNQIKSRLGEINPNKASKAENQRRQYQAISDIYLTDISSLYSTVELDSKPVYYVYAHLDTTKKVAVSKNPKTTFAATLGMDFFPFYIGKGTGNRCYDINRNETHRKVKQRLASYGKEVKVVKIASDLTEVEALALESKLIDIFGLIPNKGLLTNLDEGLLPKERRRYYQVAYDLIATVS